MGQHLKRSIPLFSIYNDAADVERVAAVIKRGNYWAMGPEVNEFEANIAAYLDVKKVVVLNSGTSALHVALVAHNIGVDDEVIVPSFTFIATANAALFVGARPVFAEIEEKFYGLDPNDVARRITSRTKAIIAVHVAGCPCLVEELRQIADKHSLVLIEDAAEAMGSTIEGKKLGTFGHSAILSFCQNKIIATGEGGAFITDDANVYGRARLAGSHGRLDSKDYFSEPGFLDYVMLGYNFRMSDISAALGVAQINKIEKLIQVRRGKASYLNHRLSSIPEITPPCEPDGSRHVYQMYTIRLRSGTQRDRLMQWLTARGIGCKVNFYPIHLTSFYKNKFGYKEGDLPSTEKISSEVLTLPMFPSISDEDLDYIAETIEQFFARERSR